MKTTYTVQNTFESFGDPSREQHDTMEAAEAAAHKFAADLAATFYQRDGDMAIIECTIPGSTGFVHEVKFHDELADEANATEDMPGRLPWATLESRIRDAAVEITTEEA